MGKDRGFTLVELVVVVGLIGIVSAVAIPMVLTAVDRNKMITSAELIGAQIREARLAAISRNTPFRIRFSCPTADAMRVLAVTGNPGIDSAGNRCDQTQPNDGPAVYLPPGIVLDGGGTPPTIQVDGRGQMTPVGGGGMPINIVVAYGESSRTLTITATGRVRTPTE